MKIPSKTRLVFAGACLAGMTALAGCGGSPPPQTTSTTYQETTTAPAPEPSMSPATAPMAPMPGQPGTTTTTTTNSQTTP